MILLVFRWLLKATLGFLLFTVLWVIVYRFVHPPITLFQLVDRSKVEGCEFRYNWIDGNEISDQLKLAVVSSEDNHFFQHSGFDWEAIKKAQKYNETHKKKRGASTISQQTAKNVFLWPARSWIRKGLEVYFTFLIELLWDKERILEMYLNVIEMGPCTYGIGAAAPLYFNTTPENLTKEQAALVASCLPNPKRYLLSEPTGYMIKRRNKILRVMGALGRDVLNADQEVESIDKQLNSVPGAEEIKEELADEAQNESAGQDSLEVKPSEMDSIRQP